MLVVDDNADLRDAIGEELEAEGYQVLQAGNGKEALETLRTHGEVSLILVDLRMPTMDGRQLIAALRQMGVDIPVVVLSGVSRSPQSDGVVRRLVTGAVDVLDKPFSIDALLRIVAQHAARGRG